MSTAGLSHGSRLVSVILAVGVHAAAAAAFMLTPKMEPPPPEGVEIEMLAEITSVVAEEVEPSVAAQSEEAEQATEARPGEARTATGKEVEQMASTDHEYTEVTPDEVKQLDQPEDQPAAEETPDAEPTEDPAVTSPVVPSEEPAVTTPIELEKPVVEAPQAPAIAKKPKPAAKQEKKVKKQQRRASVAGSAVSKDNKKKAESRSASSGGTRSNSAYASIVRARISARRPAMLSKIKEDRERRIVIQFSIAASGSVRSASISKSSGDSSLDSQIRAIVASIDFPPPPPGTRSNWLIPISLSRK